MTILKTETHLHLYGCLTAEDLWDIGKDRWHLLTDRLEWYARTYETHFGIRPPYSSWWTDENGLESMKTFFLMKGNGSFSEFQARFNLLIALNPPRPDDFCLVEKVFARDQTTHAIKEYRTFLPGYLPDNDRETYMLGLYKRCQDFKGAGYQPLIAWSLVRDEALSETVYDYLTYFMQKHPWCLDYTTGIDFCGDEKGHPPSSKKNFIKNFNEEHSRHVRPWNVLYHVGEMWDSISLASAARWVVEAAELRIKRLGHAMALGVDPTVLQSQVTSESLDEFHAHLQWLQDRAALLASYGYSTQDCAWYKARGMANLREGVIIQWTWDQDLCEHVKRLQRTLQLYLKTMNPLIETCFTSNMRIGQLQHPSQHPLRSFLDAGLRVTASTDDPGIFDINLDYEERQLTMQVLCTKSELAQMERTAIACLQIN